MTLDQIKAALQPCFDNGVFTAPDTLFGSGTLKAVFDLSLPAGQLVIDGTLSETDSAVIVSGSGQGPFAGMSVSAAFSPAGDDVLLIATGTSSGSWSFAGAFPQLADSILADLDVESGAVLVLRTISDDQHPAGLGFQGSVGLGGPLGQAAKFIGEAPSLAFAGPIIFKFGAPVFTLTAPVSNPFTLGPLEDLGLSITLNSVANPPADPNASGPPAYGAVGAIAAVTAVPITLDQGNTKLPASVVFGGGPLVDLRIAAPSAAGVTIGDLLGFALGGDLSGLMPPPSLYDVADALALQSIDFAIAPLTPALTGVTFALSSTKPWTIGSKFAVVDVDLSLYVDAANASASGTITGALQIGENGSVCTLDAVASLPQGTFAASLDPNGNQPNISDLVTYVAGDFGLPAIRVSAMQLALDPGKSTYEFSAGFATDWSLAIGDFGLSVADAWIHLSDDSGTPSGGVGGTLVLDQNNRFDLSYTIPGGFKLFAQVPSISLSDLVKALCKAVGAAPPDFDFSFTDATILITEDDGQFAFKFGAQLESYGSASVVVQRGSTGWGFAFGVLLDTAKLGALPGLGLLDAFDSAFGLDEIVVVFGTLAESTFAFPPLSQFDNPSIKAPAITSPGWTGGLVPGLNIYAVMEPAKSEALGWLCKLVGFSGGLAILLQVPEDPTTGTSLMASMSGTINSNATLTGAFGAKLVGGNLELSLIGSVATSIARKPVTFTIEVDFQANGILISGTAQGTISFEVVQLGNLAIELGVDDEGIPSIGVAAQIQVNDFDSSIAIFFDSVEPAQSMFAGSISDVTLDQVLGPIIGLAAGSVPPEVKALLQQISLKGTDSFTLPSSAATALDKRDAGGVIAAFSAAGVPIASDPRNVSILGDSSLGSWAVTDLAALTHYHLTKSANAIAGEKEAQVKFVPQTTQIGSLPPIIAGYAMSGALSVFGLTGTVDLDIVLSTGLSIEASLSPVHFLNDSLLSITDAQDDGKGPYLSLCSYSKDGKPPHATASGKAVLLGLVGESISIDISPSGATFNLGSTNPVYSYSIDVTLNSSGFAASGSASVGFNQTVDLGLLGSVPVDVTVGGTISVSLNGSAASASFSGTFTFEGLSFSTGTVTLDVTRGSLEDLASEIASAVADAIKSYLLANLDPTRWLNWVKNNIIPGIEADANKVGAALGSAFHQSADQIASETTNVLGYGADAAAAALQAANYSADVAAAALSKLGYTADQIANAIKSAFTTHADTGVHIDIPGVHTDGAPHIDTPAGPHADSAIPPHGDTAPHIDTPSGPHIDTGGNHVDSHQDAWGVGPHEDFGTPHVDSAIPPHGDAAPHVDTPSGPHTDTPLPPHGDTAPHVDTQIPPHTDASTHIDVAA